MPGSRSGIHTGNAGDAEQRSMDDHYADFDWDALDGDPDLELWLIRAPQEVSTQYSSCCFLSLVCIS